jgi:hypothetical protein
VLPLSIYSILPFISRPFSNCLRLIPRLLFSNVFYKAEYAVTNWLTYTRCEANTAVSIRLTLFCDVMPCRCRSVPTFLVNLFFTSSENVSTLAQETCHHTPADSKFPFIYSMSSVTCWHKVHVQKGSYIKLAEIPNFVEVKPGVS